MRKNKQTTGWISKNLCERMGNGLTLNPLYYYTDLDKQVDPGVLIIGDWWRYALYCVIVLAIIYFSWEVGMIRKSGRMNLLNLNVKLSSDDVNDLQQQIPFLTIFNSRTFSLKLLAASGLINTDCCVHNTVTGLCKIIHTKR